MLGGLLTEPATDGDSSRLTVVQESGITSLLANELPAIASLLMGDEVLLMLRRLMLRGGFPPAYTANTDARSMHWHQLAPGHDSNLLIA